MGAILKFLCILFLCITVSKTQASYRSSTIEEGDREQIDRYILEVAAWMSEDKYDTAYSIVTQAIQLCEPSEYLLGKYYLYAFESEILYYNSLFSPGLNSAYRALQCAEAMQNDTLTGSIQNLIGLLLSSLNQQREAETMLRSAISKLPYDHGNQYLSYRFHALSNLCDVFIQTGQLDSAEIYARLSMQEAESLQRHRAVAINYWNLSNIYLARQQTDAAFSYARQGMTLAEEHGLEDVQLFFTILLAEVEQVRNNMDSSIALLHDGLSKIKQESELTTFSKIDFLNSAVDLAIAAGDIPLAAEVQVLLKRLQSKTEAKRNAEQIKILERFYANEKKLELAETVKAKQEAESKLQRIGLWGLGIISFLIITILGFASKVFLQRQHFKTLELQRQNELLSARMEMEKAEEKMAASMAERNRIAKELHDDIGSTLSGLSLYSDLALKSFPVDNAKSKALLEKVSLTSKDLSESMSDIIWAVYSKNDTFNNLMMRMKNYAFELLAPLNVEVDFSYPPSLDTLVLTTEQRKNIYYIFKEALNNALKYSGCTQIRVGVALIEDRHLSLMIADNGQGFLVESVKKNNGFYTMQSRANTLGGCTRIESEPEKGTRVTVEVPLRAV